MANTFEAAFKWLVPSWLLANDGDAILRTIARTLDQNVARFREGLNARFPQRATGTAGALAKLGKDRGIWRGRSETDDHYAARLVEWRYPRGHRVRGSAWALLAQVSEYWGGVPCWTVDVSGNRYARSARNAEYVEHGYDWTWDTTPAVHWSRFWVVVDGSSLFEETAAFDDPALWGGAYGTPGTTVGQVGATVDDVAAMRRLMTGIAWRPAGTQPEWLVVTLDPLHANTLLERTWDWTFDDSFGEPPTFTPDATWAHWSALVAGVQEPTRDPRCRYWSLDPEHNNTYAGNPASFAPASRMPDGTTYDGDPTSFPLSATLPDGRTYAGDPTKFATSVRLPDDGDLPI